VVTVLLVALSVAETSGIRKNVIAQMRSFYGSLRVTEERVPPQAALIRTLYHGTIEHGSQIFTDKSRTEPTTYYGHDSGVGLALDNCCDGRPRRIGVIGLGTGTLAAYGRACDVFRFYDINPQVERIARNLFSYTRESKAKVEIVMGDARLSMAQEQPQNYDVIAVDAFTGDAVPVHLLTAQAFDLYLRHLRPGGVLAFHISSQYLNLEPLIKQQADHAHSKVVLISSEDDDNGIDAADWALVTNNNEFLARKEIHDAAEAIKPNPKLRLWTDDYSSLLPLMRWQSPPEQQTNKDHK
jgi:SAM-dependent methyltransferase